MMQLCKFIDKGAVIASSEQYWLIHVQLTFLSWLWGPCDKSEKEKQHTF